MESINISNVASTRKNPAVPNIVLLVAASLEYSKAMVCTVEDYRSPPAALSRYALRTVILQQLALLFRTIDVGS
jgi:hypothetical protein